MRILLIVPTHLYKGQYPAFLSITDFPVGFAYLASALKSSGHEVFGLNPNNDASYGCAQAMANAKIEAAVKTIRPELICTGGLCTDYSFLKDTLNTLRTLAPDVPVVLGGNILTNDFEYIFTLLRPDFGIIGEAEEVLVQLAQMIQSGESKYDQIPNLAYWQARKPCYSKQDFNYIDLDQRKFPDYEPFGITTMLDHYSMASRYLYRYTRLNPRPMAIVTGRSCPFNCSFCVHQRGIKYRARKIKSVLEEMASLYDKYQFNILIILDELFAVNKARLRDFSEAILQARRDRGWDFHWLFQTHASAHFDEDTLGIARRAGCFFFSYGLESASPRVLTSMNKKTKQPQIVEAIQAADRARIGFGGNFIFGDVAENQLSVRETMGFFRDHCQDIHIYFGRIQPYPGSQLFEHCLSKAIIKDKLQYYESIDERAFNMTEMANLLWLPWVVALGYLGGLFLWAKPVRCRSCQEAPDMKNSPIAAALQTRVFEIIADCPFCGQEVRYREFLGTEKIKHTFSFSIIQSSFFKLIARIKRSNWFIALFFLAVRLSAFGSVLFKELLTLRARDNEKSPFIVTGCAHCNKRLRIVLAKDAF